MEKVLGLDIGTNSLGYSYNKITLIDGQIVFETITENSIIFDNLNEGKVNKGSYSAKDRREFRSGRRINERKSRLLKRIRRHFIAYGVSGSDFLKSTTQYIEGMNFKGITPYMIREKAIKNKELLTKDEFTFSLYSIFTRRGYSNEFSVSEDKENKKEDEKLNGAIMRNKEEYKNLNLSFPSEVLIARKRENEIEGYANSPIRNKKDDYSNSLNRQLWKEEAILLIDSQKENKQLFKSEKDFNKFKKILLEKSSKEEQENIGAFEQRPLKSSEKLVNYCSFYHKFHKVKQLRRMPKNNIANIELTIRQVLENSKDRITNKEGEIYSLSNEEIQQVVNYWIESPSTKAINFKNVLKNSLKNKNIIINKSEAQEEIILDIGLHKNLVELFNKYSFDYIENKELYSEALLALHNWANNYQKIKAIKKLDNQNLLDVDLVNEMSKVQKGKVGYSKYSKEFAYEILEKLREGKVFHIALEELGAFDKTLSIVPYDYLPPLEPTRADIEWLKKNVANFKQEDIFYQPMINQTVRRVISILRRLVNDLIKKHGKPHKIVIETAKELNTKKEEEKYKTNNKKNQEEIKLATERLEENGYSQSSKNVDRVRLFEEQGEVCLYSGKTITLEEALNEEITEIEHFIPRSRIFINSRKNKILVLKKYNQNKGSKHPIDFLNTDWDSFADRS